jgi:riboflavin synthase alpha subunit
LWLIKVWFSASTIVVKIATFAKPENVMSHGKSIQTDGRCLAVALLKLVLIILA